MSSMAVLFFWSVVAFFLGLVFVTFRSMFTVLRMSGTMMLVELLGAIRPIEIVAFTGNEKSRDQGEQKRKEFHHGAFMKYSETKRNLQGSNLMLFSPTNGPRTRQHVRERLFHPAGQRFHPAGPAAHGGRHHLPAGGGVRHLPLPAWQCPG